MKATEVPQAAQPSTDTPTPPYPRPPTGLGAAGTALGSPWKPPSKVRGSPGGFGEKLRVVTILVAMSGDGEEEGSTKPFCWVKDL